MSDEKKKEKKTPKVKPKKVIYVRGRKFKEGEEIPKGLLPDEAETKAALERKAIAEARAKRKKGK